MAFDTNSKLDADAPLNSERQKCYWLPILVLLSIGLIVACFIGGVMIVAQKVPGY